MGTLITVCTTKEFRLNQIKVWNNTFTLSQDKQSHLPLGEKHVRLAKDEKNDRWLQSNTCVFVAILCI